MIPRLLEGRTRSLSVDQMHFMIPRVMEPASPVFCWFSVILDAADQTFGYVSKVHHVAPVPRANFSQV